MQRRSISLAVPRALALGLVAGAAAYIAAGTAAPVHAAAAAKPPAGAAKPPAGATEPARELGTSGAWSAYVFKDKAGEVCYLVGSPQRSEPSTAKRKPPTAMVTHRPAEKAESVVSFVEGYPLKDGSDVTLDIGEHKFELFTKGDTAWARTSELDHKISETLAKGREAIIKATPQKGAATTDVYSLTGFGQALALIDKACGVKR